jgi:predicted RNA binding protein YcfA (HicA-like mRNA interferase family)
VTTEEVKKAARGQGWSVEATKKGHVRLVPPDKTKPIVVGSGTPGDYRAVKNLLAQAKRSGLIWPWPM